LGTDLLYSLLKNCAIQVFNPNNELHQTLKFSLCVGQEILEPEKVYRCVSLFSLAQPPAMPLIPSIAALDLKVAPVTPQWFFGKLLFPFDIVGARPTQVKETRRYIEWVSGADHCYIVAEFIHKRQSKGKMRFFNPTPIVSDPFTFEARYLKAYIW